MMKLLRKIFGHKCGYKMEDVMNLKSIPKCVYCGKELPE